MGMQNGTAAMHNSMQNCQDIKLELPFDPAISLLGIYPKELKSGCKLIIITSMFIAALFIIGKMWKQPKCQLMNNGQ